MKEIKINLLMVWYFLSIVAITVPIIWCVNKNIYVGIIGSIGLYSFLIFLIKSIKI